jgi:methylamine--corrinoid protein Co-methyltransferase
MDFPGGMRTTDFHEVSQLNELKCDVGALTFTSHYNLARDNVMVEQMPIFGGFAGGLEETTIVDVATHLNSFVTFGGTWHEDGPVHMRWGITTTREALAIAGHAIMAIKSVWPNIMSGNQYYTLAGPCTVMCLLETAAQAITDTSSGRELMSGVASAKGVITDKTTGMEARFMGEVAHAVAGLPTEQTNEVLDELVKMYEGDYKTADQGKFYYECYDTEKVVPTDEYLEVYDKACAAMKSLGVNYKLW